MDPSRVIELTTAFAAVVAGVAVILLLPLYFSQRRDIGRLRAWMGREPGHPSADLRASEARLDRAESELERLLAQRGPEALETEIQVPDEPPAGLSPAAARVTSERPALERITQERAALEPHPRWRRFARRATQPKALAVIGVLAVLIGGAAIYGAVTLPLSDGDDPAQPAPIDPSEVSVSILNGTSVGGLAGSVEADIEAGGYQVDTVGGTESGFERTVVMYRPGERRAARRVARDLDVDEAQVRRLDDETAALAGDAAVVVVAGEDRA